MMMFIYPYLVRRLDMRLAVGFGLMLYSASCFLDANLTSDSAGTDFLFGQVLRGFALFFTMLFLNQASADAVDERHAEDASGLFNAARNLGGSFGLAAIATAQQQRTDLHYSRLAESLSANSLSAQQALHQGGAAALDKVFSFQASVMAYNDLYWLFGVLLAFTVPLALVLKSTSQEHKPETQT